MKRAVNHILYALVLLVATAPSSFGQVESGDSSDFQAWDTTVSIDAVEDAYGEEKKVTFLRKDERTDPGSPQTRPIPPEKIDEMRKGPAMDYLGKEPRKPEAREVRNVGKTNEYVPLTRRTWFQTLLWLVIIGGFAAFLVIYLSGNRVGLFRSKAKTLNTGEGVDEMPRDIFSIGYRAEIDAAIAGRDYRMAIRLMFLQTLKTMAEKGVIRYAQDRTNLDYLFQVHPTPYYASFSQLTRAYEYSWYGKLDVTEQAFQMVRKEFQQFDRTLG